MQHMQNLFIKKPAKFTTLYELNDFQLPTTSQQNARLGEHS